MLPTRIFIDKVICCYNNHVFCFNNKLNQSNKSDSRNQWTPAFTEWHKFSKTTIFFLQRMKFVPVFTTHPCRSVPFRCYDEKYYFRCLIWLEILLFLPWTKCLYAAKTGWKPNRKLAQGSALGNIESGNLRSERAKGRNERVFYWLLLRLQRAG